MVAVVVQEADQKLEHKLQSTSYIFAPLRTHTYQCSLVSLLSSFALHFIGVLLCRNTGVLQLVDSRCMDMAT
jgi:hypothetical protein